MNIAILDACVLYPAPLRDFLLNLAYSDLFQPKWTRKIQSEWTTNLLRKRTDIPEESLSKTVKNMDVAFPDANIDGFENIINSLDLPDPDDRHVLAAAIESKAQCIITFNLKDFPSDLIKQFDIIALHPDQFISDLLKTDFRKVAETLKYQVNSLKNPRLSTDDVLTNLDKCGLKNTVVLLKRNLKTD